MSRLQDLLPINQRQSALDHWICGTPVRSIEDSQLMCSFIVVFPVFRKLTRERNMGILIVVAFILVLASSVPTMPVQVRLPRPTRFR